jgi:hypothetical protein
MISATTTGLIAEYIACAALLSAGLRVAMAAQDRVDLVAWDEDQFYRIQVKSSSLKFMPQRNPGYHFNLASGSKKKTLPKVSDYDIVCLVGIDDRRCAFYATEQINQFTKRMSRRRFEADDIETETLAKAIEIVKARI